MSSDRAAGDAASFSVLVRTHQSRLRGFLLRLSKGDAALTDDLAQESFLEAWRKLAQYNGDGSFGGWLCAIAYSRFLMHLRRRGTENVELTDETAAPPAPSDIRIDLENAMSRLSAPERAVLTLCHAMQFSHEEAAKILEMPLGTVKSHATRGRGKLQVLLRDWNGEP